MSLPEGHVFISYCHADAVWLDRLKIHLRPLVRRTAIDLWDDSRITPGQTWHYEIAKALARAQVAILLVSADFLASDFIVNNELPPLLHRAASGGLLVVSLIISPCLFAEHEELSRYQSVNRPDRPLSGMSPTDAEALLVSLSRSIDLHFRRVDAARSPGSPADSRPQRPVNPQERSAVISTTGSPASSRLSPLAVERPLNLSFESVAPDGMPIGWFNSFGHVSGVSTEYGIRVVPRSEDPALGACAVMERAASAEGEFGSLMQRCPGQLLSGKTLRLEGELRTENVSGGAGLWFRADAEEQPNLLFDNMWTRRIVGTTSWRRYVIDAPLPRGTDWLNYGVVLSGAGVVYTDNFRLLVWTSDGRWEDV